MPVSFDEYDPSKPALDPDSNAARILEFLAKHPELGFTPKEIHEETEIPRGSIGTTLRRLEERGLIRHKEPYWSINEESLASLEVSLTGITSVEKLSEYDWGDSDPAESRIGLDAVIGGNSE